MTSTGQTLESGDIRDELEGALEDSCNDFQADISFTKPFPNALNPVLKLADLGTVKFPLSTRDADAIKSRAVQAPFGKGERTVVDKSVRDTWELDSTQVVIANSARKKFVDEAAVEVYRALGVNHGASQPRCDLYKLLPYETGSQ